MLDSFIQLIRIITDSVLPKKTPKPHRLSLTGSFTHRPHEERTVLNVLMNAAYHLQKEGYEK